jgi:N6-adenosine-specific RNA methylase IME4
MPNSLATVPGATETALVLPENLSQGRWREMGARLALIDRATGWWIGDWWNAYKPAWGDRGKLFEDPTWTGPSYATCRKAGVTCDAFDIDRRRQNVSFSHHAEVATLPPEEADRLLDTVARELRDTGTLLPARMLRQQVKAEHRAVREGELAENVRIASRQIGHRLYGAILADPPWRFEPWSRQSGMDRAAENHYPTMTLDELSALRDRIPAAEDCAMFLWAITPMLLEGVDLLAEWGFNYRTHFVWLKPQIGMGYWNRGCHELLLLGIRGTVPAPAPGEQYSSVFEGAVGEHSVKPAAAAEMIEAMFPNASLLEMFARQPRLGWDVWGAEVESTQVHDSSESAVA